MTIINIGGKTIILLDSLPSLVLSSEKLSISLGVLEMRKTRTEQNLSESNQIFQRDILNYNFDINRMNNAHILLMQ